MLKWLFSSAEVKAASAAAVTSATTAGVGSVTVATTTATTTTMVATTSTTTVAAQGFFATIVYKLGIGGVVTVTKTVLVPVTTTVVTAYAVPAWSFPLVAVLFAYGFWKSWRFLRQRSIRGTF